MHAHVFELLSATGQALNQISHRGKSEIVSDLPYAALSREDEVAAKEDAAIIKAHMKSAAESIIAVGLALKRQKERLPHGMFLPWIEAEFGMTHKTATNFMNVASHYEGKVEMISTSAPTVLYELAAPSTPQSVREQVEELIVDGQKVTAAGTG